MQPPPTPRPPVPPRPHPVGPPVALRMPNHRLFVGSYARVPVEIRADAGIAFDDLEFLVPGGPAGGVVSLARDATFNPRRPDIMLCTGYAPGTYILQALKKGTATVVAEGKFAFDALWKDDVAGPPKQFRGVVKGWSGAGAWGGGPAGPENTNVVPAMGTRRIAILLVDTSTQRYTTDAPTLQGFRDRWLNEIINGVTISGLIRSTAKFYNEVSYGNLTLTGAVFGPVSLPGSFDDYFNADGSPKGTFYQACFTAGDSLINYGNFDHMLCVSQSVTATMPNKSAWPYSSIGSWGPYTTAEGNESYGLTSMPNEWGTTNDRKAFETFSHEFGHTLGLGDMYTPDVPGRMTGSWELMDWDDPLPDFTIAHRMMLGWVQPGWMRTFDFSAGGPVDQTVTLQPIELGSPPAGRSAGIEVRKADGWNYYFEYRKMQGVEIGDRELPTDNVVLGTDVTSPPWTPPIDRPAILLLTTNSPTDGPVIANGQDYTETDTTTVPGTPFRVDVSGIDGTKANVRVRYGNFDRPDPSIRPWPASPDRQWQSPDIEVRNPRNQADPASWFNVPWEGHPNTVIAMVRNTGAGNAPQVRADFSVKDFTIGGAPETLLGSDTKDVPPGGAPVEFSTSWTPPSQGHFCIIVRIPLYINPMAPTVVEMTELNNEAQSNYTRYISRSASPASREMTILKVGNPYKARTRIFVTAGQNNPLYRTYLDHAWLTLDPGEVRDVGVMFEYNPAVKEHSNEPINPDEVRKFGGVPNNVGLAAFIEDPTDTPRHAKNILGGAQAQVVTGRAVDCKLLGADDKTARGVITTVDDGKPVQGGQIIVIFEARDGTPKAYQTEKLQSGEYSVALRHSWEALQVYYLPPAGFGDCTSNRIVRGG